ncbi:MAG TPA: hypothetical protein VEI97_15335, partial [bacterium]|nr:hypothetical protein [bacterium]
FSFSGLKTAALRAFGLIGGQRQPGDQRLMPMTGGLPPCEQELADRCAALQAAVMEVLAYKTLRAAEQAGVVAVAIGGGVAANSELRGRLAAGCGAQGMRFLAPPLAYCMDNAAMVALAGRHKFERTGADALDFDPFATWEW